MGRAPRTKETLPDFLKWHRVTRHPLVFRGLTGSQRTPGFRGVTITFMTNSVGESRHVGHSLLHFKSIYFYAITSLIIQIHVYM